MGGDALSFKAKRLTNEQFIAAVKDILERVKHLCRRIEVYPPMPEKQTHGDVDFLVIIAEGHTEKELPLCIESKEFRYDKVAKTMNCEYKGCQVDFKIVQDDRHFDIAIFYKSFGGLGSVLGYFTYCEEVSMTESGLYAIKYVTPTVKHKHLVTDKPEEILDFYGLPHKMSFKTKNELCEFLSSSHFFNYEHFMKAEMKGPSKLLKLLQEFCLNLPTGHKVCQSKPITRDYLDFMLNFFKQNDQFNQEIKKIEYDLKKSKEVSAKFNGSHIMQLFNTPKNQLNELKKKFRSYFKSDDEYDEFILNHTVQQIADLFKKVVY